MHSLVDHFTILHLTSVIHVQDAYGLRCNKIRTMQLREMPSLTRLVHILSKSFMPRCEASHLLINENNAFNLLHNKCGKNDERRKGNLKLCPYLYTRFPGKLYCTCTQVFVKKKHIFYKYSLISNKQKQ